MSVDEALVHDFSMELNRDRAVSDETFERARTRFGEQGVVDLLGLNGYYTLLAMVMNGAQTPAPLERSTARSLAATRVGESTVAPARERASDGALSVAHSPSKRRCYDGRSVVPQDHLQ